MYYLTTDQTEHAPELAEVIDILRGQGFGKLIDILLDQPDVWTKSGRINKSALGRHLGLELPKVSELIERYKAAAEPLINAPERPQLSTQPPLEGPPEADPVD